MNWKGVISAMTTAFKPDYAIDHAFVAKHAQWQIENGCDGVVAPGSLGESATLAFEEKVAILKTLVSALGGKPVVAGVAALGTAEGVALARAAEQAGCAGLMVLPPYVYASDWREMKAHVDAVLRATRLTCMLYNNPPAYGTDVRPEQLADLAAKHANLVAVKESSEDVRRVTAIRGRLGERVAIFVGVDDLILEGVAAGAVGWVAGLVNALPVESVRLFELAASGRMEEARALYDWFLPLLRLDVVPKFVQLIKLVQQETGTGSERVRPPRLPIEGKERDETLALIRERLAARPKL